MTPVLVVGGIALGMVALGAWAVRDLVQMRKRPRRSGGAISSGVAGIMADLERFASPSVEHVMDVNDRKRLCDDDVAGD